MSSVGDKGARDASVKDPSAPSPALPTLTVWVVMAASAVMIALSAAINFQFGHALGVEMGQPMAYAFASLAADGLKILTPLLVLALWTRAKLISGLIGALGLICVAWSCAAVLGVAGAALKGAGGPVDSLSDALGLDASMVVLALPLLLAILMEVAAALGAFVLAFQLTKVGGEAALDFEFAPEADDEIDWTAPRAPQATARPVDDRASAAASSPTQDGAPEPGRKADYKTDQGAHRGSATPSDRGARSRRNAGKSAGWSIFRRKPKVRAKGEGTAPPLDEPQPAKPEDAEAAQNVRQHHGRALHNRVKSRLEEMERKARESKTQNAGAASSERKDSA